MAGRGAVKAHKTTVSKPAKPRAPQARNTGAAQCRKGVHEIDVYPTDRRFLYCVRLCGYARWAPGCEH